MKWFGRGKSLRPAVDSSPPATDLGGHESDSNSATADHPEEAAAPQNVGGYPGSAGSETGALGSVGLIEASEQIGAAQANEPDPGPAPPTVEHSRSGWWFTIRRIIGWFSTIFMIALLFLAWPLAWGGLFSYTIVSGNSMEPEYHTGDVVMTYRTSEYKVGDIIVYTVTFDDKSGAIIHRITEVLPDGGYKTQGDNNDFVDPWVAEPQNIRGEVIAVFPQAYKAIALIRSPLFWILPIGVMVAYFLWPAPVPEIATDDEDGEPEKGDEGDPGENPDGSTDQPTDSEPRNPSAASR